MNKSIPNVAHYITAHPSYRILIATLLTYTTLQEIHII